MMLYEDTIRNQMTRWFLENKGGDDILQSAGDTALFPVGRSKAVYAHMVINSAMSRKILQQARLLTELQQQYNIKEDVL